MREPQAKRRSCELAKLKAEWSDRQGEIMTIAKCPVITAVLTTSVYDVVQIMAKEGFRRIPIVDPRTRALQGIVTSTDIVDYLGGGRKFEIIQRGLDGSFFKAINEPVKSIMRPNPPTVRDIATIGSAIELMRQHGVGGLPVVDNANRVLAIVTEKDLLGVFEGRAKGVKVVALMTKKVVTGTGETTIIEAGREMVGKSFRRLPLVSDGRLVGIITAMDIVRFFGSGEVFQHLRSGTILQVLQTPAAQIGTKKLVTTSQDADVTEAARTMKERDVGALLVVDDEKLVGMLTERDFFKLASRA
jgi:CBS domain-containing protein